MASTSSVRRQNAWHQQQWLVAFEVLVRHLCISWLAMQGTCPCMTSGSGTCRVFLQVRHQAAVRTAWSVCMHVCRCMISVSNLLAACLHPGKGCLNSKLTCPVLQFLETPAEIRASAQQDDLLFFVPMNYDPVSSLAFAHSITQT